MAILVWTNTSNKTWLNSTPGLATPELYTINEVMQIFQLLFYGIFGEAMAIFGIGTNIINIICFVKMGFRESVNISLLALAISDFGCLLTMVWSGLCYVPMFQELDLPFEPLEFQYLITGTPHFVFTRITSSITALITLERCLCVKMPLKVKTMFTPQKVAVINVCIFIIIIVTFSPIYFSVRMGMVHVSRRNRTVLGIISLEHRIVLEQVSFAINSLLIPAAALLIILVCMVTMVITLQRQTKWRQSYGGSIKDDAISDRDERLVKMIIMISTLFIVCFLPSVVIVLLVAIEPEFNIGGKYIQMALFAYGFSTVAESTNSSMNIFIYHKMSRRYRASFDDIFKRQKHVCNPESNQSSVRQ